MSLCTSEELLQIWEEWHSKGAREGTQLRFGQYFINFYTPVGTIDPLIFYHEDHDKAYHLIYKRYVE